MGGEPTRLQRGCLGGREAQRKAAETAASPPALKSAARSLLINNFIGTVPVRQPRTHLQPHNFHVLVILRPYFFGLKTKSMHLTKTLLPSLNMSNGKPSSLSFSL